MSCAFSQPPTLAFAVPLGLLALVAPPPLPTLRSSVALPGVPAAPTLALAAPIAIPVVPAPLPALPTSRARVSLPGLPAAPTVALAVSLGVAALLLWVISLSVPRSIPCPLD
jgi:hypothetical protein